MRSGSGVQMEDRMGLLIDGEWHDEWYDTESTGGRFQRQQSTFRNWITNDGSPGPSGDGGFPAEGGRYHLYVSHACSWVSLPLPYQIQTGQPAHSIARAV